MKWILASVLLVLAFALPATASAEDGDGRNDGFIMRVTGDVTIGPAETVGSVLVIDGTVTVDGTIKDSLTVIDGTAIVNGTVRGQLTVIEGTADLRAGSTVEDINLISSNILRADGVTVLGEINDRDGLEVPAGFIAALSIYFWVAMTLAIIVAGIVFAGIGGRQLNEAAQVMTGQPMNAFLGTVFFWVGVPALAVLAMLTVVGIPLGLGVLLVLLPIAWFLGYIVAGARLGLFILQRNDATGRPLLATTLGLIILQLGVLVPVIGAAIAAIAGFWGAGALAFAAYRAAGGKGVGTSTPTAPVAPSTNVSPAGA